MNKTKQIGEAGVKKWIKSWKTLFSCNYLFFPVNQALHWSLIVVSNPEGVVGEVGEEGREMGGRIEYLDSLGNKDRTACERFLFFYLFFLSVLFCFHFNLFFCLFSH